MNIFISGGCKNGKSFYAQRLAKAQQTKKLYYIATMKPVDYEDVERITRHRAERAGWGFTTIEEHNHIENILHSCDHGGSFLIDSLTALLAGKMFPPSGGVNEQAAGEIATGLSKITETLKNVVLVSDYIYSDAFIYDPLTEKFRRSLAELDRIAAKSFDIVLEVTFAETIVHKGKKALEELYEKAV